MTRKQRWDKYYDAFSKNSEIANYAKKLNVKKTIVWQPKIDKQQTENTRSQFTSQQSCITTSNDVNSPTKTASKKYYSSTVLNSAFADYELLQKKRRTRLVNCLANNPIQVKLKSNTTTRAQMISRTSTTSFSGSMNFGRKKTMPIQFTDKLTPHPLYRKKIDCANIKENKHWFI